MSPMEFPQTQDTSHPNWQQEVCSPSSSSVYNLLIPSVDFSDHLSTASTLRENQTTDKYILQCFVRRLLEYSQVDPKKETQTF